MLQYNTKILACICMPAVKRCQSAASWLTTAWLKIVLLAMVVTLPTQAYAQRFAEPTGTPTSVGPKTAVFAWPAGKTAAVSLAYDDALPSQLDIALPQLNKAGLKASFYLPLSAPTLSGRLADWRAAAAAGHELGNHSLFHQCSRAKPGRSWVSPQRDLDTIQASKLVDEIRLGNAFLQAIDGKTVRTYTAPCTDQLAHGEPYLPLIQQDFVAIKALTGGVVNNMQQLDPYQVPVLTPHDVSGAELIALVQQAGASGGMVNFTFHGVGGDHLSISAQAHQQLVDYLAANPQYWTAPFVELMQYVKQQQAAPGQNNLAD